MWCYFPEAYLLFAISISFSDKDDTDDTVVDIDEQELLVFSLDVSEIFPTLFELYCWWGG